jgi:hypothetical protein
LGSSVAMSVLEQLRRASKPLGALSGSARAAWTRIRPADPIAGLIMAADAIEAGFDKLGGRLRALFLRRSLKLTAGLVWRCAAALTGVGLVAMLVSALSDGPEPSLASVSPVPEAATRSVRDVRRDPLPRPSAEGEWRSIARPVAMFGLESPELERQPAVYEAQQYGQDGTRRRDDLTFGQFADARPHLQLRITVEHDMREGERPFVVALAREAAERGMSVQRSGLAHMISTRFGAVETADARLSDGEASRPCIAFRKSPDEMPLGLSGWWCGTQERPADRQQLICLLDRLNLLSAGEDRALRTAFARSELNRQPGCAAPRLAATGRKVSWLDADGRAPPLKTAVRR